MPGFLTVVWAPTAGRIALAMLLVAMIVWICVRASGRDRPDDADDDDAGGGGGGGGPPRPQPPGPPAPSSWSDFERQFASYVARGGEDRFKRGERTRSTDDETAPAEGVMRR